MTNSNLFVKAHKITKEDKVNYPEINYIVQFGLNLKALYSENMKKEEKITDYPESRINYDSELQELTEQKERQLALIHNAKIDNKKATVRILEKNLRMTEEKIKNLSK